MPTFVQTKYLPAGNAGISISSETQAWRMDVGGGITAGSLTLPTGVYVVAIGLNGDAAVIATDIDGNDVSANIKAGYFLPSKTTFQATSPKTGGSVAMAYINPSFTEAS